MKFIAMYMAPAEELAKWMELPEEQRKDDEEKMRTDWDAWMATHGDMIVDTKSVGTVKRVSKGTVEDIHNDLMLYSIIEAESAEVAAEAFVDHPHFGIPGGTIEIMSIRGLDEEKAEGN